MAVGAPNQALSLIFDNYANVIEGGTHATFGTRIGIPGRQTNADDCESRLSLANAANTTTTIALAQPLLLANDSADLQVWPADKWSPGDNRPPFYLCIDSGKVSLEGSWRRISSWSPTTLIFTVATAFPAVPQYGIDYPVIRQGFKRAPDGIDIESVEMNASEAYDRYFSISAMPGEVQPWYGNNVMTFRTTMEVRLRINKAKRSRKASASVLENLAIIRAILTKTDYRETTYTRALLPEGPGAAITIDDASKVVAVDKYTLIYRIDRTLL